MTVHSHARDHAAPRRVFAMAAVFAMAVADASAQPTFVIKSSSSGLVLDVP